MTFKPDWASPPADTVFDLLKLKKIDVDLFRLKMNFSLVDLNRFVNGEMKITPGLAFKLSQVVGGNTKFWFNRDKQYQQRKKRLGL